MRNVMLRDAIRCMGSPLGGVEDTPSRLLRGVEA